MNIKLQLYFHHLIPLQFVEILDKNRIEIFEGDLLKCEDAIMEVKFGEFETDVFSAIGWYVEDKGSKYPLTKYWANNDLEIVGNIFENQDLLQG